MINIRNATQNDIKAFREVIKSSIVEFCKDFYTPSQIESLLAQFPEPDVYVKWLKERTLIVAEAKDGIAGFAQYTPGLSLVEAVHVSPVYARHGIGRNLMKKIEEIAIQQGANKITLESSLNAEVFYMHCGYTRIKQSTYVCKNGVDIKTVTYEKSLHR